MLLVFSSDPDEAFEFLRKKSSRSFYDLENERVIQGQLYEMPQKYEQRWEEGESFSVLDLEYLRDMDERYEKIRAKLKDSFSVNSDISATFPRWSDSCSKEERRTQTERCQVAAKANPEEKNKCRKAQNIRRNACIGEVFEFTPEDSASGKEFKTHLKVTVTGDLDAGIEFMTTCHENHLR